MATFEKAITYVIKNEKGDSDDPADYGGATHDGITLKEAIRWGITTKEDLFSMSDSLRNNIYKADYWFMDGINDQRVATKFFDMYVNRPPRTAIRLLQVACNNLQARLEVDGIYGPKTEAVVNACDPSLLLDQLVIVNVASYKAIVEKDPTQVKWINGWLNRARRIPG
jgi:lysozyme family protein